MKRILLIGTFLVILLMTVAMGSWISQDAKPPLEFTLPIIINHGDTTSLCLSPAYMLNAWYDVERCQLFGDTIDMESKGLKMNYHDPWRLANDRTPYKNDDLIVVVDTMTELTLLKSPIWARYLFSLGDRPVLQDDSLVQFVKSFPIYVANCSSGQKAKVQVQDGSLIMVVEALNESSEWMPIEYWSQSWCGNSYYYQILEPGEFLMTRGIKCSGEFDTECRMKLLNEEQVLYSNSFQMSIDPKQFEQPLHKDPGW